MRYGVWVEGSSTVVEVVDGPSAFRWEARCLANGQQAWVVWQLPDGRWMKVPRDSVMRPAPAPPAGPRKVAWWDRLGRGGRWLPWLGSWWPRKHGPFARRRL